MQPLLSPCRVSLSCCHGYRARMRLRRRQMMPERRKLWSFWMLAQMRGFESVFSMRRANALTLQLPHRPFMVIGSKGDQKNVLSTLKLHYVVSLGTEEYWSEVIERDMVTQFSELIKFFIMCNPCCPLVVCP